MARSRLLRFFAYLNLFVFAMLLLVMGDNFGLMFFGWEAWARELLLIGFWYEDLDKAKAGMKAFVVNRIGDFGFVWGSSPSSGPLRRVRARAGRGSHARLP